MQPTHDTERNFTLVKYWTKLFRHFGVKRSVIWGVESILNMLLSPLPLILGGSLLRGMLFRPLFRKMGRGFFTSPGVKLLHCYNIETGDRISLSFNVILNGRGGLKVGDDFVCGPGVVVWTAKHLYGERNRRMMEQGEVNAPVEIGNDVWCGTNAMIMPGVRIGDGTVIFAGAVVTKDTPPYSVVAGVPARVIRYRM